MAERIKILHAITRLDRGGSSENTLLSAIGLVEKGYEVTILFGETAEADVPLLKKAEEVGVDFILEEDLVRNIHPVQDMAAFFDILRFLKRNKFDIVHAHSSKAGFICRIAAKLAGIKKIVYTPHGHVFYGYFGRGLTRLILFVEAMTAHITDKIIGLTPAECEEWLSFGVGRKEQYTSIPSGVDFDLVYGHDPDERDLREELGIPKDKPLVGSVGRFVDIKGYEYFIMAAAELAKKRSDVCFILAGDGPLRERYNDMIRAENLQDRFHIIGWQKDIGVLIKALDIFILPSLNEGMGRVLVEAMALGKPVIATKVGGVPSIVSGGAGVAVEPHSSEALSDAIEKALDNPEETREMIEKGREKVLAGYSASEMVDRLDKLYKELLG
ncbi:glycosyltransferase family 4 protein [Candidatus Omnitrophota bacterium]